MKTETKKAIGTFLVLLGAAIVCCSKLIVFPGLEKLVGIETIVGKESVVHLPDGGYAYTNPGRMLYWIFAVAALGTLIFFVGVRLLLQTRTGKKMPACLGRAGK
jgi:hypothetical protein